MVCHTTLLLAALMLLALALSVQAGDLHWLGEPDMAKDFFPIMVWDTLNADHVSPESRPRALADMAECGFTIGAYVEPKDLPECERLGLKAIIRITSDQPPWNGKWETMTDEQIDQAVKKLVEECGNSNALIGYYIVDEPRTSKFPALAKAVAAVRKHAPGKLAYINLFPGFGKNLEQYVTDVSPQMISWDNYNVFYSDDAQSREGINGYYRDLMQYRQVALAHGIPFWNTICACRIRPFTTVPSPANLLYQAYTTLAAGGRGIAWYPYWQRGIYGYNILDLAGNRTDTWQYVQMVNKQVRVLGPIMNHLKSTGVFFTDPRPADNVPPLPGRIVEAVESRSSIKGFSDAKPPIMVGEFEGEDGCDYVMIVNVSLDKSANVIVRTKTSYASKEVISAQDGSASPIDEENGHWLVPGQGVLIKLTRPSSGSAAAE
jgi:hypothetical protein